MAFLIGKDRNPHYSCLPLEYRKIKSVSDRVYSDRIDEWLEDSNNHLILCSRNWRRTSLRVRRSLTIKQMAAVAVVALVTICILSSFSCSTLCNSVKMIMPTSWKVLLIRFANPYLRPYSALIFHKLKKSSTAYYLLVFLAVLK